MMDFASLRSVEKANTKTGTKRGQNWKFRFKRSDTKNGLKSAFFVSDSLWNELGLEVKGMKQFNSVNDETGVIEEVYLGIVPNDDAIFLKKTNKLKEGSTKGKNFKAVILEGDLATLNIIDLESFDNQFLDLESAGEQNGVSYYLVKKSEQDDAEPQVEEVVDAESPSEEETEVEPEAVVEEEEEF